MKQRSKYKYFYLLILLTLCCFSVNCTKKFIWKGNYISISTKHQPKEDFVVGKFIVVSYAMVEYKKDPTVLYQFVVIENGRQTRLITVDRHREMESSLMPSMIFLEENNSSGHFTYINYNRPPEYQEVKNQVIQILSNQTK